MYIHIYTQRSPQYSHVPGSSQRCDERHKSSSSRRLRSCGVKGRGLRVEG